jgi:protein transport protein SEC61 subunit gamma-like protein
MFDLKSFAKQCVRVWKLLKKPCREEFTTIAKVSIIGLAIIGLIGFVIALIMETGFKGLA